MEDSPHTVHLVPVAQLQRMLVRHVDCTPARDLSAFRCVDNVVEEFLNSSPMALNFRIAARDLAVNAYEVVRVDPYFSLTTFTLLHVLFVLDPPAECAVRLTTDQHAMYTFICERSMRFEGTPPSFEHVAAHMEVEVPEPEPEPQPEAAFKFGTERLDARDETQPKHRPR